MLLCEEYTDVGSLSMNVGPQPSKWREDTWFFVRSTEGASQDAPGFHTWTWNPAHWPSSSYHWLRMAQDPWPHRVIYKPQLPYFKFSCSGTLSFEGCGPVAHSSLLLTFQLGCSLAADSLTPEQRPAPVCFTQGRHTFSRQQCEGLPETKLKLKLCKFS